MRAPQFRIHRRATGLLIAVAALLVVTAPLAAQTRKVPVAEFQQSFEVSLDSVHWSRSITQPFPYRCELGGTTLCGPRTPDVRVYTRWTPLPAVNMTQVHIQGMTGPYRIDVSPPRVQSVCEAGASYPLPSSGFPITIRASRPGGPFPITCTWVVAAVVARPPGSTPAYELVRSNPATVTLTMRE
ncbi:MAG TPA: hypothetical protein VFK13_07800 [Gemmatimonadaceae bacterium]|nr:hypothetical protein [Gemmatimonadaceae bacterium]